MVASSDTDPKLTDSTLGREGADPSAKPETLEAATGRLRSEWQHTITALKRSLYVERQALNLRLFDIGFRVALGLLGGFVALTLGVSGALLVVIGARRGLVAWTNDAWWADVVLGAAILGILGLGAHLARRAMHRGTLARTRAQLGLTPASDPDVPAHLVPPPTRDGR